MSVKKELILVLKSVSIMLVPTRVGATLDLDWMEIYEHAMVHITMAMHMHAFNDIVHNIGMPSLKHPQFIL